MRLISLTANNKSFHPVKFNETGISLIVGKREEKAENEVKSDSKKTYNGIGKSLIIQLIHFCLGCNPIDSFKAKLPGWEFTLAFKVGEKTYRATRNTADQKEILLDGEALALPKFKKTLEEMTFPQAKEYKYITFRSLLPRFIRYRKESYIHYDRYLEKEEDYQKNLNLGFLLGLDVDLMLKKVELKTSQEDTDNFRKNLEKDHVFQQYFSKKKNLDIEVADYEERIKDLTAKLKDFKVSENYEKIRKEADDLSKLLRTKSNSSFAVQAAIRNIDKTLELKPDVSNKKLIDLFEEAKVALPESVKKNLDEVSVFHKRLITNRSKRLLDERKSLENNWNEIEKERISIGQRKDKLLQYLNTHGALEEYTALNEKLKDLSVELDKLTTARGLFKEYKNKLNEIEKNLIQENIAADNFLDKAKETINRNLTIFRNFSKEFYEDKPGGIEVLNNEKVNKLRFDITAHIQDDASDGIAEVKIFCFDWAILLAGHNHNIRFLFHDGRLLSNMDPRQRATSFKLAHEYAVKNKLQYIISANEDILESLKAEFSEASYQDVVAKSQVLELSDKSSETKLLGIEVDMDYEAD